MLFSTLFIVLSRLVRMLRLRVSGVQQGIERVQHTCKAYEGATVHLHKRLVINFDSERKKTHIAAKFSVFRSNFPLIALKLCYSIIPVFLFAWLLLWLLSIDVAVLIHFNFASLSPACAAVCFHSLFTPLEQRAALPSTSLFISLILTDWVPALLRYWRRYLAF